MAIFFGLASLDLVYFFEGMPYENGKGRASNFYICAGGPAANAAMTYKILGGNPLLLTPLGDTVVAKKIIEEFNIQKLKIIDISNDKNINPTVASIAITAKGKNRTIWSHVPNRKISLPPSIEHACSDSSSARFVHFDGYYMQEAIDVASKLKNRNYTIVLDAGSWKDNTDKLINLCDIVIASSNFKVPESICNKKDTLLWFKEKNVKHAAITNNEKEIIGYSENETFTITPPQINAKDTLGAGDIFHGAFDFFFFDGGLKFIESIKKASIVASQSCAYYGPREGVIKQALLHK